MLQSLSTVALALAVTLAPSAATAAIAGGPLPRSLTVDEELLRLNGAGVYAATRFRVDVFAAGLYVAEPTQSAARLLDSEEALTLALRFARPVSQRRLVDQARRMLDPFATSPERRRILEELLASLRGAGRGDLITFTHRLGGLEVAKNGQPVIRIADDALARYFFASWIGPQAFDVRLAKELLGAP